MKKECVNYKKNLEKCPCTYSSCDKRGMCCECLHYHRTRGELPACYFTSEDEKTYNRSIEFFIQRYGK